MDKLLPPPPLASDERFSILANIAAERFAQLDLTALMVYLVDLVDASALPALAEQFHVQGLEGWLFTTDEREKRELIKQAIELHKYKEQFGRCGGCWKYSPYPELFQNGLNMGEGLTFLRLILH